MTQTTNMTPQGFGQWLRYMREQRGMSQAELAELVGRKQPSISKLEEGGLAPSGAICIQFAQVFDMPVEIILAKAGMIAEAQAPMEAKSLSKEALDIALRIDRLPAIERERLIESTQANLDVVERRLGKAGRLRMIIANKSGGEPAAYPQTSLLAIA